MEYREGIEAALDAAYDAVRKLYGTDRANVAVGRGAYGDLTYKIDRIAEEAIIRVLKRRFPDALILSEELGISGDRSSEKLILVDPLDGSTNAVRTIPFFSSSIALCRGRKYRDIVAAGVRDLAHDLMIIGSFEEPVTVNGRPARPSSENKLHRACISLDIKADERIPGSGTALRKLLGAIKFPRFLGSAALETAYVATGIVDAFVEPRPILRTFDCIPSIFLVERAGGFVRGFGAKISEVDLTASKRLAYLVSGNDLLGKELISLMNGEKYKP